MKKRIAVYQTTAPKPGEQLMAYLDAGWPIKEAEFVRYGVDYQKFEEGPGNYSVAIMKQEDGRITNCPVDFIQFLPSRKMDIARGVLSVSARAFAEGALFAAGALVILYASSRILGV